MPLLQSLKKFLVDYPITGAKQIFFWCFNFFGMHFSFLYTLYYYLYVRRQMRIDKNGRVCLMQVGSIIVNGCNLRCEFCESFSPFRRGVCSADALISSYTEWREKLQPRFFILSGGEPFLHPEMERIVRESAKIWNDSRLWLGTNGLFLDRVKPEVLQAIKETGYGLIVSEHTFDTEHRKRLNAGYARLKQEGIPFVVRPSRLAWVAKYRYENIENGVNRKGKNGKLVPYMNNPRKALDHCRFSDCSTIHGNQLCRCAYLLHVRLMTQEGVLDGDLWKAALAYSPITLQSTPKEILEHLRCRVRPECTICPEKNDMVPAQQVPLMKNEVQTKPHTTSFSK